MITILGQHLYEAWGESFLALTPWDELGEELQQTWEDAAGDFIGWLGLKEEPPGATEQGSLRRIQEEQREWVRHNFGDRPAWQPLLGIQEEVGELAHAFLKRSQGIRTGEDHDAAIHDAVADIVIFLLDFCSAEGIDLESQLEQTWAAVRERDWKTDPTTGGDASSS